MKLVILDQLWVQIFANTNFQKLHKFLKGYQLMTNRIIDTHFNDVTQGLLMSAKSG